MKIFLKALPVVALLAGSIVAPPVWADATSNLEARLDSLEQQVSELKQELKQQKDAAALQQATAPAASTTTIAVPPAAYITANSKDGFAFKSADGNYTLKIGGYTQIVSREFGSDNKEELDNDSAFLVRRARLIIQGTVAGNFDYYLQPDFGYNDNFSSITSTSTSSYAPSLYDAWIDYRYSPDLVVKAGKMKMPFDLENLQDSRYTDFVELGLTSNLSPQRDVGVQVGGNLYYDWITYAAGVFNGAADHENAYGGASTAGYENDNATGVGRIFMTPFKDTNLDALKGFGAGFAASYGKEKGFDVPASYVTPGQAPFFSYNSNVQNDGPQLRTEPQAYYYYKSFGILGEKVNDQESLEYITGSGSSANYYRDRPDNKAYSVAATYVLTGENASYSGVTPKHDFDPSAGHWGAFELAGRYDQLKLDSSIFSENFANLNTSASEATTWGLGLNWYLNKNAKVVFDYEQTKFNRGAANGASTDDRKTENLFLTLLQLSIG